MPDGTTPLAHAHTLQGLTPRTGAQISDDVDSCAGVAG